MEYLYLFFFFSSISSYFLCTMATKYTPFCEESGTAHSTLSSPWCPECGSRTRPTQEAIKDEAASRTATAAQTSRPTPTPIDRSAVREGTADQPIALEDSPRPARTGVFVPASQNQPFSRIQLAPGVREAEHAHMMNEVTIAKRKSLSARGTRTPKPNRLQATKEIHGTLLKVDLKIMIVHYFLQVGSDTSIFIEAEMKRKSSSCTRRIVLRLI